MIHKIETEIELYDFDSLSKEAKETALNWFRDSEMEDGFAWDDEALKSLKAFVEYFGATLRNYSIDFSNSSYSSVDVDEIPKLTAIEQWKLVKKLGDYDKKTLRGTGECLLTGVCFDENLIDGARIFIHDNPNCTTKELIMAGYNSWLKACQEDYEHQLTDEALIESIDANDYYFDAEGYLMNVTNHVKDHKVYKTVLKLNGKEIDITKQLAV